MTNDELQQLRALCEAATPGPWRSCDDIAPRLHLYAAPRRDNDVSPIEYLGQSYCDGAGKSRANLEFICAAREALPQLLDECEARGREREEAQRQLKFTHPVFNYASKGSVEVEPDGALPGDREGIYRIVRTEDIRRFREEHKTTARPPYLATVYSQGDAWLVAFAFNEFENVIRAMRQATTDRDRLRAEVERLAAAMAAVVAAAERTADEMEHDVSIAERHRVVCREGGQHVGTGGQLGALPPSGLSAVRRYAQSLRAALDGYRGAK